MNRSDYQRLAEGLMQQHGLQGWRFEWDRAKRRLGCCHHRTKVISLSAPFSEHCTPDQIRDTILHEIAHALVGKGHGHGPVWRRKAREIGANPVRCGRVETGPVGPIIGTCPNCGSTVDRFKRPPRKRQACGECCRRYAGNRFDERFIIQWARQAS